MHFIYDRLSGKIWGAFLGGGEGRTSSFVLPCRLLASSGNRSGQRRFPHDKMAVFLVEPCGWWISQLVLFLTFSLSSIQWCHGAGGGGGERSGRAGT